MSLGRNDLCRCKSGFKYKHCCLPIDQALDEKKLKIAQKTYLKHWSINADHFAEKGYYKWMADQLNEFNPKKILDVGTGNGNGIVELIQKYKQDDFRLISIDENEKCLKEAASNITAKTNYRPEIIKRIKIDHEGVIHVYDHKPLDYPADKNIVLLESDILAEPNLHKIQQISGKLDAVTIWLMGTHKQRFYSSHIFNRINSATEYRLKVQNKTYELADKILKKGGVLQVVDRAELPEEDYLKKDHLNSHRNQASVTNLKVDRLNCIEYEEPEMGVKMEMSLGLSGRIPTDYKMGLVSVISIKQ